MGPDAAPLRFALETAAASGNRTATAILAPGILAADKGSRIAALRHHYSPADVLTLSDPQLNIGASADAIDDYKLMDQRERIREYVTGHALLEVDQKVSDAPTTAQDSSEDEYDFDVPDDSDEDRVKLREKPKLRRFRDAVRRARVTRTRLEQRRYTQEQCLAVSDSDWTDMFEAAKVYMRGLGEPDGQHWISWLLQVRSSIRHFGLRQPRAYVFAAIMLLPDPTLRHRLIQNSGCSRPSFTQLCTGARRAFAAQNETARAIEDINGMKQRKHETLQDYLDRVETLLLCVGSHALDAGMCDWRKRQMLAGLDPYTWRYIENSCPLDLELADALDVLYDFAPRVEHWGERPFIAPTEIRQEDPPEARPVPGSPRDRSDRSRPGLSNPELRETHREAPPPPLKSEVALRGDHESSRHQHSQKRHRHEARQPAPSRQRYICRNCGFDHPTEKCSGLAQTPGPGFAARQAE
jgi:hypothetical protein